MHTHFNYLIRLSLFAVSMVSIGNVSAAVSAEFKGKIGTHYQDSEEWRPADIEAPDNAPNVLIWLLDDAGFAHLSSFGGLVNTPTLDKLAETGLRYTNFHATGVCAPTRASLLSGRNHHAIGYGAHIKDEKGFPGYNGLIPKSAAPLARILQMNGYSTYAIGKWDQLPDRYASAIGPFDYWPSGQGFDHYYGFMAAEADQFRPQVYVDHTNFDPGLNDKNYHFTTDMADRSISSINRLKAIDPKKPFFLYWATGAIHSPHHVPEQFINKYKGKFDMGWDKARETILAKQKSMGIVPKDTVLPERTSPITAWGELSPEAQKMQARQMEVLAAMLEHSDYEFGRILESLQRSGQLENTLIIVTSDNGASAEGGPEGTYNELRFSSGLDNHLELNQKHYDAWGTKDTFNHSSVGWSMVGNTPFKYYKQNMFAGGVRVPTIVNWQKGGLPAGEVRDQFHHINDIAPTVLAVAGIKQPKFVDGIKQENFDGKSITYSFNSADQPSPKEAQYFELWGNRAIWSDGWKAVVNHHHKPWKMAEPASFDDDVWELYHVEHDVNETTDVAKEHPKQLAKMKKIFHQQALKNNVYPLKGITDGWQKGLLATEKKIASVNGTYTYFTPGSDRIIEKYAPPIPNRNHTITAEIVVPKGGVEGVIASAGGLPGGYSFYVKDNHLMYTYNFVAEKWFDIKADEPLTEGKHTVSFEFKKIASYQGVGKLSVDGKQVAKGNIDNMSLSQGPINETFDVGSDHGSPASPNYKTPFAFTGSIEKVTYQIPKWQLVPNPLLEE